MDLSDGLADGLHQIARASGTGMTVQASAIPLAEGASIEDALTGGDDYELLFTVRPSHRGRFRGARREFRDVAATKIGVVTKGADVVLADESGTRPVPGGYEHFRCD